MRAIIMGYLQKDVIEPRVLDELQQWLQQSTAEHIALRTDYPVTGTQQWVESHPVFSAWLDSLNKDSFLLVQGQLGFGKSVLALGLANKLRDRPDSPMVAQYEFSSQRGPSMFAASILSHVFRRPEIQSSDALKPVLVQLQNLASLNTQGPDSCSFAELWGVTTRALALLRTTPHFVVVDGLDQYHFDNGLPIQKFLKSLKALSRLPHVRVAVFSRPQLGLEAFAPSCLQLVLTEQLLAPDIELFAAARFGSLGIPPEFRDRILERIRLDAKGSFLWVLMLLLYLSEPCAESEFLRRLRGCPPTLSSTYDLRLQDAIKRGAKTPDARQRFVELRRRILLLVCEAREPLLLSELGRALSLGPYNVEKMVMDYCKPLVSVSKGRVRLYHPSTREFLTDQSRQPFTNGTDTVLFPAAESHRSLALQCLRCLLDPEYASKGRIGQLLHRNFGKALQADSAPDPAAGLSWGYAARHWDFHLVAVDDPDDELLRAAGSFLHQPQFAYWSEWSFDCAGSASRAFVAGRTLQTWAAGLSAEKQALLGLDGYFSQPYTALSESYRDAGAEDKVLQWLALMRLGRYYVDKGANDDAAKIRMLVRDGLIAVLGTNHPLSLQARTDFTLSLTFDGRYEEAYAEFKTIVAIEDENYGTRSRELYRTLLALGETELYLTRFRESLATQARAATGFLKFYTQNDKEYLSARMWYCYPLIELGRLDEALEILAAIVQKRTEGYGADDLFAASARFSVGVIQRKQRNPAAVGNLGDALRVRRLWVGLASVWALDFAIELLVAYRDFGETAKAADLLAELDAAAADAGGLPFNRTCQVEHVRGLLQWDGGRRDAAIGALQGVLIGADRDQYNRALLWMALDLAGMLRARGGDGDARHAEAIFNHILVDRRETAHLVVTAAAQQGDVASSKPRSSDDARPRALTAVAERALALVWPPSTGKGDPQDCEQPRRVGDGDGDDGDLEPDPPRLLRLAERALTLVRNRRFAEVDELMSAEQVAWARLEDLWLWSGSPAADTAWMKPPDGVEPAVPAR
ncbi:hypothetical protein B0T24DRAFT_197059 [Lasiosphaeria ovina]|uniref:Nephrocystin 3-like N-terminal domain-containing protein n=1 Tax=Lasiosphaeria ovina TaxID=92902 RepID=A0AAE0NFM9_9PEZI|nr:hypothetical protein B0T24DRAFT_197059 [Lasiosphaeria ovina]